MLLEYFGQTDSFRCGKCDICTQRNELNMSKYEFDLILEQIKQLLAKQPLDDETLIDQIKKKPENVINVIAFLLDNGKIIKNSSGLLTWHKTLNSKDL